MRLKRVNTVFYLYSCLPSRPERRAQWQHLAPFGDERRVVVGNTHRCEDAPVIKSRIPRSRLYYTPYIYQNEVSTQQKDSYIKKKQFFSGHVFVQSKNLLQRKNYTGHLKETRRVLTA